MRGSQEPRISVEPQRFTTDGGDAAALMEAYAKALDPWQRTVLDCWLGKDLRGSYTVTSAGLTLPRQNGKNVCIEAVELFAMTSLGEHILHTAHQVRTAKKSFRRLVNIFTDPRHPELCELVRDIRYTNGEEAIFLAGGASIEFMARSRQAARGFDAISRVIFDEAQELTDDQLDSVMATLAASDTGNRQLIYAGTPPYPGCPGTVFRRRRTACLSDPGPHDAWHEWSVEAEKIDDIRVEDTGLWYMTNPALGIHLDEDFTREELRSMSADGFARERLCWWAPQLAAVTERAIREEAWDACRSESPKPEGKTAYGIKFSPDGTEVVLCGAVCPADGPARISLIDRRPTGAGLQWLADWLTARYTRASCVAIDGRNGVDVLVEKIAGTWKAKNCVIRPKAAEVVAAASHLINELGEKTVTWYGPQDALRASAITATKRPIGGGWGFGGDDPAPIEAAALALWACRTSKRDPTKKMKVG